MEEKIKEAIALLSNSKSKKRESGAKRLRKLKSISAGPDLIQALEKELTDKRTWSTQYHLILAIGHSGYVDSLPKLIELAKREFEATILYMGLGDSIFRLSVISNSIKETLTKIYSFENFRITYGAFQALALLQLIPDDDVVKKIIEVGSDPRGAEIVKGYPNDETGLRKWVASASAGWKDELKNEFLSDCEKIKDQHLLMAVENSRKNKYVNWKPY